MLQSGSTRTPDRSAASRLRRIAIGLTSALLVAAGTADGASLAPAQVLSSQDAGYYAVRINGELLATKTLFVRSRAGRTFLAQDTLGTWNMLTGSTCTAKLAEETFCLLDTLPGIRYTFNIQQREVAIEVAAAALPITSVEMPWGQQPAAVSNRGRGAFINYDFHLASGGSLSNGPVYGYSGLLGGGISVQGGTLTSNVLAQLGSPSRPSVTLLDTLWQHDDVAHHSTLLLGDAITSGGTFGGELRYFGIGWKSNFEADPRFTTGPTVGLSGISSIPSTVDLFLNNALTYSKDVPAGPFEVNNVPTVNGLGEVKVVVRDLLGRQQIVTGSYYGTSAILRPGLSDYALEAGFGRMNYGLRNLQYGPPFVEANVRRGISNRFTAEFHAELEAAAQEVGCIGNWLLPHLGVIDAGVAANRGVFGQGAAALVGYTFQDRRWNAGTTLQLTTPGFWQVGNGAGDFGGGRQANVHFGLQNERGDSAGFSYIEQTSFGGAGSKVLALSADRQLRHGDLQLEVLQTSGFNSGLGVQLYYHVALAKRRSFNFESDHTPGYRDDRIDVSRRRPAGGLGYASQLQIDSGDTNAISTQLTHYGLAGNTSVTAMAASGGIALEADITGGIAYLDHRPYLTSRMLDAFAVVHVGYPHVHVYEDGQPKGVTDRHGDLALSDLSAYDSTTLSIEPKDLPPGIVAVSDSQTIVPTSRAAASIYFATQHSGNAAVTVLTPAGRPLSIGTLLRVGGIAMWPIGANGSALLRSVVPGPLRITASNASMHCHFTVTIPKQLEPVPNLGSVRCTSDTESQSSPPGL